MNSKTKIGNNGCFSGDGVRAGHRSPFTGLLPFFIAASITAA
ncbi:MAG: hypothetical protein ABJ331_16185 [Marinobacter sp.]